MERKMPVAKGRLWLAMQSLSAFNPAIKHAETPTPTSRRARKRALSDSALAKRKAPRAARLTRATWTGFAP